MCPVCHEPLGPELVILPCGHQLCCKCSISLVDRQSHVPQVNQSTALFSRRRMQDVAHAVRRCSNGYDRKSQSLPSHLSILHAVFICVFSKPALTPSVCKPQMHRQCEVH